MFSLMHFYNYLAESSKARLITCCVTLLSVALLMAFLPSSVRAQSDCIGVDLVILVDNSDSMKNSDPGDLRVYGVRAAVENLGNNILYDCPDETHRLAVIGFGDKSGGAVDTEVYLDNAVIAPRLEDFRAWREGREQIKNAITIPTPNLGATDYRSAFEAAEQILSRWKQQSPDGRPRLRGIALMTDGSPCVIDSGCLTGSFPWRGYMEELKGYLEPTGNNFPWRGDSSPDTVRIWLIALQNLAASSEYGYLDPNGGPYGGALYSLWNDITDGHKGSIFTLRADGPTDPNANRDVSKYIVNVVDDLTRSGVIAAKCDEPFFVQPYTGQLMVRILKIGSNPDVPLEDVKVDIVYDGPRAPARFAAGSSAGSAGSVVDYVPDGPNEYYLISEPAPGEWRIEVQGADACRDLDVAYLPYPLEGQLLSPVADASLPQYDEGEFYDPGAPAYFQYLLYKGISQTRAVTETIHSMLDFPLSAEVNIKRPDGSIQQLDLEQIEDNTWRSTEPIETPLAGIYEWSLAASSPGLSPGETLALPISSNSKVAGAFDVLAVDRFHLEIVEPAPQAVLLLNQFDGGQAIGKPVRIVARVINDITGNALEADALEITGLGQSLLSAVVSDGSNSSAPIELSYQPIEGGWVGEFVPGENEVPTNPGPQHITVKLNRNALDQERFRPSLQDGSSVTTTVIRTLDLGGELVRPHESTPIAQFEEGNGYDPNAPVHLEYAVFGRSADTGTNLAWPDIPLQLTAALYMNDRQVQTFELLEQAGGVWRSTEPINVAVAGDYHWELTAEAATNEYAQVITGIEDQGDFKVEEVRRFHIDLIEPKTGEQYAINRFERGLQSIMPLPISVALIDDATGERVTPDQLGVTSSADAILSGTIALDGQISQPITLSYSSQSNAWEASAIAGEGGVPEDTGKYRFDVSLNPYGYDRSLYRPSFKIDNEQAVEFERIRAEPIVLTSVESAITQATYVGSMQCLNSSVAAIPVHIQVENQRTKQVLNPASILRTGGIPLAAVWLIDPQTNEKVSDGIWSIVETSNGAMLETALASEYPGSGRFSVLIEPNPEALRANYQFFDASEPLVVAINRTYSILADPRTCQQGQIGLTTVLVFILLWMIFNWTRRPRGTLELVATGGSSPMTMLTQQLGRSPILLFRPYQVVKIESDPDISKIVVRKGKRDQAITDDPFGSLDSGEQERASGGKRAIRTVIYDQEGGDLMDTTLAPSDSMPITQDLEVRYH